MLLLVLISGSANFAHASVGDKVYISDSHEQINYAKGTVTWLSYDAKLNECIESKTTYNEGNATKKTVSLKKCTGLIIASKIAPLMGDRCEKSAIAHNRSNGIFLDSSCQCVESDHEFHTHLLGSHSKVTYYQATLESCMKLYTPEVQAEIINIEQQVIHSL